MVAHGSGERCHPCKHEATLAPRKLRLRSGRGWCRRADCQALIQARAVPLAASQRHHEAMRLTYDADADAAFIYLSEIPAGAATSSSLLNREMSNAAVIAVFNQADHLVGIEVLGASQVLPPETLEQAEQL